MERKFPPSTGLGRAAIGVVAGSALFVVIMLGLAGLSVATGVVSAPGAGKPIDLRAWILLEIVGGSIAGVVAGRVSRHRGDEFSPVVLGALVCVLGLIEVSEILRYATLGGGVLVDRGLAISGPPIVAVFILIAGRPDLIRFARLVEMRRRIDCRQMMRFAIAPSLLVTAMVVGLVAVPNMARDSDARVVSAALALDLTVMIPVIAYLLIIRARRLPWLVILPVAVLGYAIASAVIPGQHQIVLKALRALAIPIELGVVVALVVAARRALVGGCVGEADFPVRVRQAAERLTGGRIPAGILSTEVSILYYAFAWPSARRRGASEFTVHREIRYLNVLVGLLLVLLAETFVLHAIVSRASPTWAWILTALSFYGAIWLIGDYRALGRRPIRLVGDRLLLRIGLRWEAEIPLRLVERVEARPTVGERRGRGVANLALLGQPNLRLLLREPIEVRGMYGLHRTAHELRICVDDAQEFRAALKHARDQQVDQSDLMEEADGGTIPS